MLCGTRGDRTMQYQAIRQGRFLRRPNRFIAHVALDGGEDGLDFYRAITANWKQVLAPGGRLYFEVGIGQAESVGSLMEAQGFADIQIRQDLHGIPRVVFGDLGAERLSE